MTIAFLLAKAFYNFTMLNGLYYRKGTKEQRTPCLLKTNKAV